MTGSTWRIRTSQDMTESRPRAAQLHQTLDTRHGDSNSLNSDDGVVEMMQMIDVLVRYNTREEGKLVSHLRERKTGRIDIHV
jgi:hypothetical protein